MTHEERIIWDTTKYPIEYPEKIKKIYFKTSLVNRKPFTKWIGNISKNFSNDIDWWISLPLTRDSYLSNLFHYVCVLRTLEKLKNQTRSILVKVNSKHLFNIIKTWLIKNNLNIKVYYVRKSKKLNEYFIIPKCIIFHFFLFFFIRISTKKIDLKKNINKIVLIDTFATKESIKNERLYKGLDVFFIKKKIINSFFVPTFIIERNLFNIIKIIKSLNKKNYLFKEHHLNFRDIIFSTFNFLRTKKYIKKFKPYYHWDLNKIIWKEITSSENYPSKVNGILNYQFAKNLYNKKINIKKTINWFENQTLDKGWNLGFRRYFKKIKTYGYQGFLHFPHFMHSIPAKHEEEAKVIPSEVITIGKAYKKLKKEFFPNLKVSIGPALNYLDIFKENSKRRTIKVLIILSGIKLPDTKLLEWCSYIEKINKNLKIVIKPHPILPLNKINLKTDWPKNYFESNEKLSSLLQKTNIVVCSGPTSATIESLAYDCFLIVPVIDTYDELSLKILNISKKKYCLIYNEIELAKRIKKEIKKKFVLKRYKKNNLRFKKFLFENINNKNLKYYY